jgi:hypothetical protein
MADKNFQKMVAANPDTFGNTRLPKPTRMAYIYQQFEADIIDRIEAAIVADLKGNPLVEDKSNPTILKVPDMGNPV